MLEVWLLSSLIVVNVWSSSRVKHFSLCQGLSSGTALHTVATGSTAGCTDRLCLITESSAGKVCVHSIYRIAESSMHSVNDDHYLLYSWWSAVALVLSATITHYCYG